ncbi:MAG: transcription-repair coupling factor, partial [Rhodospirillales bacterium]|nr:transcription-repair coupling factor [Rhodospirillales bacterium]
MNAPTRVEIGAAPEGHDATLLCAWANRVGRLLVIVADDVAMARTAAALAFFDPDIECLTFPAWDCLPYDRVSPSADVLNQRISVLSRLLEKRVSGNTQIIVTTVSAFLQRIVPRDMLAGRSLTIEQGSSHAPDIIIEFLTRNGYVNSDTVREPGEFARRGGILDIYPADSETPYRLDFFGDEIDSIRIFDSETQRTTGKSKGFNIIPLGEVYLDEDSVSRFRSNYREAFSITGDNDPLYESISAGRRYLGMEHWLPLFHEVLETLLDYTGEITTVLANQAIQARDARLGLIDEYFAARQEVESAKLSLGNTPYHPVPKASLYLDAENFEGLLAPLPGGTLSSFDLPESEKGTVFNGGGHTGHDFADVRVKNDGDLFSAVTVHIQSLLAERKRVVVTAMSEGSRDRLRRVFVEHDLTVGNDVNTWADACAQNQGLCTIAVASFDRGFFTNDMALITEQDILGERLSRPQGRKIKPENIISDAMTLNPGDLVVHVDHGIGRFDGLYTIEVSGAPHDCLQLTYHGDARLFLPVENIELVSRFGSDDVAAQLDRLGGAAWQARKAKLKERIAEMAEELIKVAAARELNDGAKIIPQEGIFEEFCARFPYTETEDQKRAIDSVLEDLASGRNADRLVCGDVGFGKTEIAMRAAFATAMEGKQVAIVVPTTLLCRQHHINFAERFRGFPIMVRQLSRFITTKEAKDTKEGLTNGTVDIVIGTHALLAKDIRFRDLGLLIIDEEQHFGVSHKERLKSLKADVHVLTLTATPIPRTLQLALSGVREMSLIATPPVDRLAVRTYILPFDPVIIREAILRERYRGGQTFYVCPRISDLEQVEREIRELVPEVSMVVVHGQMPPARMEETVTSFYDGNHDVLLSTNIIESGIDMPRVNSIIIHRADRFGLSQLYQLRGRVGRSKIRAY